MKNKEILTKGMNAKRMAAALLMAALLFITFTCSTPVVSAAPAGQHTNLPAIYITLDNSVSVNQITKEAQLPGRLHMRAEGYEAIADQPITIKGRGNSTWNLPKKPYQIKFETKTDLLGMGKAKKWILLANYWDKTLMRNAITYNLANKICSDFSTECRFVDVFINGQYRGNYLLTEKIEFGKERIDDDAEDGAVLFELEQKYRHSDCSACLITDAGVHVTVKEPEENDGFESTAQFNSFKDQCRIDLNKVEQVLSGGYDSYSKFIDVESFVDWYILNELAKNYDAAFVTSTYCYFTSDGILHMGPVWDVDVCFGNQDVTYPGTVDNGLNYYNYRSDKGAWYMELFKDEYFVSMLKDRWSQLFEEGYIDDIFKDIDKTASYISESQKQDQKRWPEAMGITHVRGKGTPYFNFSDEVKHLTKYLRERVEWLDSQWNTEFVFSDDRYALTEISSVPGTEAALNFGTKNSDGTWSWNYSKGYSTNAPVDVGKTVFNTALEAGEYYYKVAYKASYEGCTDYFMVENLVNAPGLGTEISSLTPAARVSYATSEKDNNGYAEVYLKFSVDSAAAGNTYGCRINSYNADVTVKEISLYKMMPLYEQGDIDRDNNVAAADALLTLQHSVGKLRLNRAQLSLADVDGVSGVSASDALRILQRAVGKISAL